MIERIMQIIENKGISKNKFYTLTGLSNGFLDKVKDVGVSKAEKILKTFPDINSHWLITGEGQMLLPNSPNLVESYLQSVDAKMSAAPVNLNTGKVRSEEDELLIKFLIGRNKELEAENERLKNSK